MACSLGRAGHALFLDTRSMRVEHIPLPASADLVVINSSVRHAHAGGEYKHAPARMRGGGRALGVPALRDVELDVARTARAVEPLPDVARAGVPGTS